MIQNNILRKENEMLKKQEEEVDSIIKNKKKWFAWFLFAINIKWVDFW